MSEIAVIGGSRYFGRLLIENLRDTGADVTVINRGSTPPPAGVAHLTADRDDPGSLRRALAGRRFDVLIDQVCYTPAQAETAARAFDGVTGRYVLTSTVEVYADLDGPAIPESAVDPAEVPVRLDLPWHDPDFRDAHYGAGKRQAEAVLTRAGAFDLVSVRVAHVLGGDDFTGRLRHYAERVRAGRPVVVHADPRPATFIHHREIADFLAWTARAGFTGPVNAAAHGTLTARDLCAAFAAETGEEPRYEVGADVSPYSFARSYPMANGRAEELGHRFSTVTEWLPEVVREALACVTV
ncbi:NAD-dependent epimerase/dehydratase family protein [Nonomuraea sp. NN258]|uniref:NAD-dependent epimerase/dehydratase family protein n=1 Tax=Nonomuraea antri TaxID=2730852 RepID=UPI001568E81D|nr:NAD-dependent epimerase/dehydratase family protein [Nonomuraea antri]NRQ36071.1 NAD-dependent epimerase/dehydratase family protein [Nonomuraea antri]